MWWVVAGIGAAWFFSEPAPPTNHDALLKPGLWALGASTTAYVGLAAMEGLHDRLTDGSYSRSLMERRREYVLRRSSPLGSQRALSLTVVGLNLSAFMYCQRDPRNVMKFVDSPRGTWTLLTCAFCHTNIKHLASNMASLLPEIPHLLQVCGQSPYQFVAFYVSAAIFSSYAQRAVSYTRWTQTSSYRFNLRMPLGLGASGVVMAVFGASCFTQPWTSPSFLFSASTLGWQVANDLHGLIYSNKAIGFAVSLPWALHSLLQLIDLKGSLSRCCIWGHIRLL
jgi:membrane associated rhomboid family serine protease